MVNVSFYSAQRSEMIQRIIENRSSAEKKKNLRELLISIVSAIIIAICVPVLMILAFAADSADGYMGVLGEPVMRGLCVVLHFLGLC